MGLIACNDVQVSECIRVCREKMHAADKNNEIYPVEPHTRRFSPKQTPRLRSGQLFAQDTEKDGTQVKNVPGEVRESEREGK